MSARGQEITFALRAVRQRRGRMLLQGGSIEVFPCFSLFRRLARLFRRSTWLV